MEIHPIVKDVLWTLLELIVFVVIFGIIGGLLGYFSYGYLDSQGWMDVNNEQIKNPYLLLLSDYVPFIIASMVALVLTHSLIFKREWSMTGFIKERIAADFGVGYGIAFGMLLIGFLIMMVPGWINITDIGWSGSLFFGFLLLFLIQSSFEEIVSRSFMIPMIAHRLNMPTALLVSSSLFSILHFSNPGITYLALLNIFLAGLFMGILYLSFDSIWPAIGFHAGWNFLQGSFFGFVVSGLKVYSLIKTAEQGPDLLTGGSFGMEGSILTTILLAAGCYYYIRQRPSLLTDRSRFISTQNEELSDELDDPILLP